MYADEYLSPESPWYGEQPPPGRTAPSADFSGEDVNAWYQQYWGRPAEAWEQDYWGQQGLSAGDVERTLSEAPEAYGSGGFEGSLPQPRYYMPGMPVGTPRTGGYPVPAGGGRAMSNADAQAFFDRLFPGGTVTPQDLEAHRGELEAAGFRLNPNAAGLITDLTLPSGDTVDPIYGAGAGINRKQWIVNPAGGAGGAGGNFGGGITGPPGFTPFNYERFQGAPPFSFREFAPPTGLDFMNDPGYRERLKLGTDAIERSAAARGTLLTGGTLKDLSDYAQTFASNEFGNVYNRALQTYGTQYGQAATDYNTNWQNALNAYTTNFQTAFQPWQANYNAAYQNWMGNLGAQQQRFNQLFGTANMGLNATGQFAGAGQNYANNLSNILTNQGNQAGDLITGGANARAAGQVGSGNAYADWWRQMGDLATLGSIYGTMPPTPTTTPPPPGGGGTILLPPTYPTLPR